MALRHYIGSHVPILLQKSARDWREPPRRFFEFGCGPFLPLAPVGAAAVTLWYQRPPRNFNAT